MGAQRYKPNDTGFDSRWCNWNFSLNPSGRTTALGSAQPLTQESTSKSPGRGGGDKGGRCFGLETLPPSTADRLEIWVCQPPGTRRRCPPMYRDCFTFSYLSDRLLFVHSLKHTLLAHIRRAHYLVSQGDDTSLAKQRKSAGLNRTHCPRSPNHILPFRLPQCKNFDLEFLKLIAYKNIPVRKVVLVISAGTVYILRLRRAFHCSHGRVHYPEYKHNT